MRIRTGFVSNSSSASFLIERKDLTEKQIEKIANHIYHGRKAGIAYATDDNEWEITVTENMVLGFTLMDNFDMKAYLEDVLKIPPAAIVYEDNE